ncbi:MAG: hypothetical protein AAGD05_16155, partial [Bacteroidota bacterium]
MKKYLFSLFFLCFVFSSSAQFGLNLSYRTFNASGWERTIDQINSDIGTVAEPLDRGWGIGLDYWFRLKNYRIEFLPELNYSSFSKTWSNPTNETDQLTSRFLSLHFNTNIYLFDLSGDCDCPTFSKQGDLMQKGFFVQVSPGLSWVQNQYENLQDNSQTDNSTIAPSIGLGVG